VLNKDMLAQLMIQFARVKLADKPVTVAALATSDANGVTTVATVEGPLVIDENILNALAEGFAQAVVLHLQTMGQADPVTGKIF